MKNYSKALHDLGFDHEYNYQGKRDNFTFNLGSLIVRASRKEDDTWTAHVERNGSYKWSVLFGFESFIDFLNQIKKGVVESENNKS